MQTKLERDVRFLKIYAGVATLCCVVFVLSAFAQARKQKFDEIDVERVNIVEKDGKLRMVISNRANGKVRLRISVDGAGDPKMDFLDETGKVTYSLPR
jgi:hypothetical protein